MNVTLTREPIFTDHLYGLKVYVDGKKVGRIYGGETKSFTVPKDSKTIYGKLYWAKTRSFNLKNIDYDLHLTFKQYKTSNPLIILGIIAYPLELLQAE